LGVSFGGIFSLFESFLFSFVFIGLGIAGVPLLTGDGCGGMSGRIGMFTIS
jgi:hypothetical protein